MLCWTSKSPTRNCRVHCGGGGEAADRRRSDESAVECEKEEEDTVEVDTNENAEEEEEEVEVSKEEEEEEEEEWLVGEAKACRVRWDRCRLEEDEEGGGRGAAWRSPRERPRRRGAGRTRMEASSPP